MKYLGIIPLLILLVSLGCKKRREQTELEKLPAITQTGANTFGCLINGKAYTPYSRGIFDQVLQVYYDPTFQGGQFTIKAKNISDKVYLTLHADSIAQIGSYQIGFKSKYWISYFAPQSNNCTYSNYYEPPISGILTITRFDLSNRIVSGVFTFKFNNADCGAVETTDGRFDVKY
jgi:hypothetical protein